MKDFATLLWCEIKRERESEEKDTPTTNLIAIFTANKGVTGYRELGNNKFCLDYQLSNENTNLQFAQLT